MRTVVLLLVFIFVQPMYSEESVNKVGSCKSSLASSKKLDGVAGWGTKLIPPTYFENNSRYRRNFELLMTSDNAIISPYWWVRGHSLRDRFDDLMVEWNHYFSETINLNKNEDFPVVNNIQHSLAALEFRSSGTEANNYFYEISAFSFQKRTGKKAKRPQMIFFGSPMKGLYPYGGVSGRISEMSIRYNGKPEEFISNYLVQDVQTKFFGKIPANELKRLKMAEDKALKFIRKQITNDQLEIGGIFIEPISVTDGIHFFRPEFLLRLRDLADELKVPIMADEVFTGGGRTGEFWGFQNYKNFYPDLISFGKGLELKGVGWIKRRPFNKGKSLGPLIWDFPNFNPYKNADFEKSQRTYENVRMDNTSVASAADVLRALVVMESINGNNILDSVKSNGAEILQKIRDRARTLGIPEESIQGIGMIFHLSNYKTQLFPEGGVLDYEGRVTPYITTKVNDWPLL